MIKLTELIEALHKPIPKILYHATFNQLLPRIESLGLLPKDEEIIHNFEGIEPGVYLDINPEAAGSYVEASDNPKIPEAWFENIVVIAIDTSKLDHTKFDVDPNVQIAADDDEEDMRPFIYRGTIPPSAFIEIKDYY